MHRTPAKARGLAEPDLVSERGENNAAYRERKAKGCHAGLLLELYRGEQRSTGEQAGCEAALKTALGRGVKK